MKNWAFIFTLDHEGANVRNIYYTAAYFELENITNPASGEAYTDAEITAVKANAAEGNSSYIFNTDEGALIGMQAFDTGKIFWYDDANGRKIVSSAAPLLLDGKTGEMKTADGITAALPM